MYTPPRTQDALLPSPADSPGEALVPAADAPDDDPEEILLRAVAEIATQPLPSPPPEGYWPTVFLLVLFICSYVGGTIIALLTYPTVTITVVPVTKDVTLTTPLALATRPLAPVSLSKTETAPTTGKDHQDARAASGMLTFYNGLFTAQTLPAGTVFTGRDGMRIVTGATVIIPAGNPPSYGQANLEAQALQVGSTGDIAAGDVNTTLSSGVLVRNGPFSGGRGARDFPAVAPSDLDHLNSTLKNTLSQQMPQAFALRPGEVVQPLDCTFIPTPNHQVGEEASTITVRAVATCKAIAYNNEQLSRRATQAFTAQARPGVQYQLVGDVQVHLVSATPLLVSCRGLWAYSPSQDYEQFLAQQIAGDSPQQAKQYLLQTGFFTRAEVSDKLPQDPAHIHFQVLVGI